MNVLNIFVSTANMVFAGLFYYRANTLIRVNAPDLAAIILTAVSIIVTVLGVIVAIAALWGYKNIAKNAEDKAIEAANNRLNQEMNRYEILFNRKIGLDSQEKYSSIAKALIEEGNENVDK